MIIFGTRGVTYTKESGTFYCPHCGPDKQYTHKRVRRFFTLYFIPVIPLDLHGEYVECKSCRGTYRLEVLDMDLSAADAEFEAEFHKAIKWVMVDMMLADGVIDDDEVTMIRRIYSKLTDVEISEAHVRREITRAEEEQRDVVGTLRDIAGNLNDNGKEMVVKAAMMVAMADGEFQDEEKELMKDIGCALEMTGTQLKGVIRGVIDR